MQAEEESCLYIHANESKKATTAANEPKKKSKIFILIHCWVLGTYRCIFGDHTDGNFSYLLVMTI